MQVHRSINEPIRENLAWVERWEGADRGLIACWERGREKSRESPALASQAREGQLVVLPWKGGVEKAVKKSQKFGTLYYLAMWQGLRGDDLQIDIDLELTMVCSATRMTVIYTSDPSKYADA